ncbi:bifunctional riboflavin kinase/FAD synthetase [Peptoniphilus equinus]|uniref:Riboflavin biosynthesis protein n=1 Tax=Peptoniphilus equinus TaxID=3016343 RepID=A0ABY7QVD9_9FIRM|nr:bifunctional riboflavin kinase/FAD synthetase [Peptoniphilus equinus]WBW50682.1 bifunctional riboflavin kinase/FAD synthetase [Peptoniphilus equinus]
MKILPITVDDHFSTPCVIALGNFDGVHRAHQALLREVIHLAEQLDVDSAILAFKNHTKTLLTHSNQRLITSNTMKYQLLESIGISRCYELVFSRAVMALEPEAFVKSLLLERLNVKGIVVGYDYRFGNKAKGNVELLKRLTAVYDFQLYVVDEILEGEEAISSTRIRSLIESGNIQEANALLGYEFTIDGTVIHGKHLGTVMGMPTANIEPIVNYVLPKFGVYTSWLKIDGRMYPAATNIGKNPSIENEGFRIEAHILDFNGDIYGKTVQLILHSYLRPEMKFDNLIALFEQMHHDVATTRKILNS